MLPTQPDCPSHALLAPVLTQPALLGQPRANTTHTGGKAIWEQCACAHTHTHELKLLLCCPNTNWDTAVLQLKPVLAAAPAPRQDTKTRQPPCSHPPYVILLRPKSISCNNQVLAVSLSPWIARSLYTQDNSLLPSAKQQLKTASPAL